MPGRDQSAAALAPLQVGFARALMWADDHVPDGFAGHSARAPQARFNVYRNNIFASLTATLRARFPVVERLVGEEFFAAVARVFIARHPPCSPVLLEYGAGFAGFLETFEPAEQLPYLPDVARLEWLRNVAYHATDRTPLDPAELARIPAEDLAAVSFELHPSAGLLTSPYPAVGIWETNTHDSEVRVIAADAGGEDALVVRPAFDVVIVRLGPGGHTFAAALADGAALAAAAELAALTATDFSLPHALSALIGAGALTACSIQASR